MSRRDKNRFLRIFQKLTNKTPSVTALDVANECRAMNVSYKQLVGVINENGYKFFKPRQKGLLPVKDRKRTVFFV